MSNDMSLFVFTVIGGTRYFNEWYNGVRLFSTPYIYVVKDDDRSEELPFTHGITVLHYRSGKPWHSYDRRHDNYESDYSILLGFIKGVEEFIETPCTHAIHIDSDVIVNSYVTQLIMLEEWDYLQIGTPVIPRDRLNEDRVIPMRFWDSTNMGFSKQVIENALPAIREMINNPYPVDFNIHNAIRMAKPSKPRVINVDTLAHYIKGRRVLFRHAV